MSRPDKKRLSLKVAVEVYQVTLIVFSALSSFLRTPTWLYREVGTRMSRFGISERPNASDTSSVPSSLETQSMFTMDLSWLDSTHKSNSCSCGIWDLENWLKIFHLMRNFLLRVRFHSIQLNSKRTLTTWSLRVALDRMKSRSSMVIASSNLATEFTTCRGRASLQTLAIVEICSLLEVAMVLSAASMSPKSADH